MWFGVTARLSALKSRHAHRLQALTLSRTLTRAERRVLAREAGARHHRTKKYQTNSGGERKTQRPVLDPAGTETLFIKETLEAQSEIRLFISTRRILLSSDSREVHGGVLSRRPRPTGSSVETLVKHGAKRNKRYAEAPRRSGDRTANVRSF